MWQRELSIETSASPATVWRLSQDVAGWKITDDFPDVLKALARLAERAERAN